MTLDFSTGWGARRRTGPDAQQQFPRFERLRQVIVRACFQARDAVGRGTLRRQKQDGHGAGLANLAREVQAIHAGHHDVQDDEVNRQVFQLGNGIAGIARGNDRVAMLAEITPQKVAQAIVVVHHQDMRGGFVHRILTDAFTTASISKISSLGRYAMVLVPMDDRDGFIWIDGRMVPWREATLHVLSHGLHYASAVFEGDRSYNGTIFKLTEHSERLRQSARLMGFEIPYTTAVIDEACNAVVKANNLSNGYVRPIAWRGSEQMGVSAPQSTIHVAIAAWEWPSYFSPELREQGIRLAHAKYRRPAPDSAPTQAKAAGLYMICTISKHAAEAEGAQDALMLDHEGRVAEATGANLFMVKDGKLHTPVPDSFLNGITRQTIIGLAARRGLEVVERGFMAEELMQADEIFLTGTAAEVTAVGQIGEHGFKVGNVTRQLRDDYELLVKGNHQIEEAAE